MLKDRARTAGLRWNALNLFPSLAGCLTFVNATARGSDDVIGIARIDVNREYVGIINDPGLNGFPSLAAVGRLIWKIPGSRVDDVRGSRIDGERLNMNEIRRILRR